MWSFTRLTRRSFVSDAQTKIAVQSLPELNGPVFANVQVSEEQKSFYRENGKSAPDTASHSPPKDLSPSKTSWTQSSWNFGEKLLTKAFWIVAKIAFTTAIKIIPTLMKTITTRCDPKSMFALVSCVQSNSHIRSSRSVSTCGELHRRSKRCWLSAPKQLEQSRVLLKEFRVCACGMTKVGCVNSFYVGHFFLTPVFCVVLLYFCLALPRRLPVVVL